MFTQFCAPEELGFGRCLTTLLVLFFFSIHPLSAQAVKWTFEGGFLYSSSPALGGDGVVYIGSIDENLYAILPDGTQQWSYEAGTGDIAEGPSIAEDGTVYVATVDGVVHAVNPDGTQKWTFDTGAGFAGGNCEIAIAFDRTIYAGALNTLYAINPDGTELWTFDTGAVVQGVSQGLDGNVFVTTGTGIVALDPEGNQLWTFGAIQVLAAPAIDEDGTIYFGDSKEAGDNFWALNPDGSVKWAAQLGARVQNSPVIDVDGSVYVVTELPFAEGFLVKLDADGTEQWRFETEAAIRATPAIGSNGILYFGTIGGDYFAVNRDGDQVWMLDDVGDIRSSATIAPDGTVYFGSFSQARVYAVTSTSAGLAPSIWPKKQADTRNTGRLESGVANERWFAPHVYWVDDASKAVLTVRHRGGSAGRPNGRTTNFQIHIFDRDGSLLFSLQDSIDPGQTKDIVLAAPGNMPYAASAVIEASPVDADLIAFFLTWEIKVSDDFAPFRIGVFFSQDTEAALIHDFPAEASVRNGLGVAIQNIGENEISCTLDFFNADGSLESSEGLEFAPLGSVVGFFNDRLFDGFVGSSTIACDAPIVAIAVNQDFDNGGFPTDRITAKGQTGP